MMTAAATLREHPCEVAADIQQYYGIDVERARFDGHSAWHMSVLIAQLPQDCRVRKAIDADMQWTLENVLLAAVVNNQRMYAWGRSDPAKRGPAPKPIGPSYMTAGATRTLPARALPVSQLMEELSKPRRA